ncbi:putative membrane protein [Melissococcus plutonius]|uniref:EpaQ family protein n=1 Tax=Melissococcus plutonius TaxID=33970 RepID=UPI00065DCEB4|nr:EpaQ family protein [Melissococcus plutonius]AIM24809.1 putative membrane protein [Melissococcus plutonius S1]KMT24928.1 putative membrane protein [Melissococcus plutonius]KMT26565.1 putative membrane protein [Melissococcus plutonius]KMT27815.1 putative membrane protein [Melissococcus plutonius]KMT29587.1 putative membrane protein [Melissococcus plutonius]
MEKITNRIGRLLLLMSIASSYVMWVFGISTKVTSFMYAQSMHLLLGVLVIILILNVSQLKVEDWLMIGLAVGTWELYTLTSEMRHSTPQINGMIPIIILLVICFKVCPFDKIDRTIMLLIVLLALVATLSCMYIELPKIIPVNQIFRGSTKVENIWINTNTIGASLLFSALMGSILIKMYNNIFIKSLIIPIYAAGLIGIWACKAKTAFVILIAFIILDNLVPKSFLQKTKFWLFSFVGIVIGGPFLFYYCSQAREMDLFTGRQRIWKEFFAKWLLGKKNMLFGMTPFQASWKPLSTHNAFLYTLSNFGIIGYFILFGLLLYIILRIGFQTKKLGNLQIGLFIAFLVVWCHSFMEDILLAYHWMPIVYSFLGLAFIKQNKEPMKTSFDVKKK